MLPNVFEGPWLQGNKRSRTDELCCQDASMAVEVVVAMAFVVVTVRISHEHPQLISAFQLKNIQKLRHKSS